MVDMPTLRAVVVDFGFTLSSEHYFKELGPERSEQASQILFGPDCDVTARWMRGLATSREVADYLAGFLEISPEAIHAALVDGCSDMRFNDAVWDFVSRQRDAGRKLALVTTNADIFRDVVVPAQGLDDAFDAIVSSADFKMVLPSKQPMWDRAFESLGPRCGYGSALLVEDTLKEVRLFRALGGRALHYRDDPTFAKWLESADL
jgi:FMN phosphatase YigB (HAD superfamily)